MIAVLTSLIPPLLPILVVFFLLALLPATLATLFREYVLERKHRELFEEMTSLRFFTSKLGEDIGGEKGLKQRIAEYNNHQRAWIVPALLLSTLYLCGFGLCYAYLKRFIDGGASGMPFRENTLLD